MAEEDVADETEPEIDAVADAPVADQAPDEEPDEAPDEVAATGHAAVDELLRDLGRLEDLDVHEHVAVFEAAHQGLRRALDDGGR